jgi:ribosomal protein S18 acetylase RimI-like enzyme
MPVDIRPFRAGDTPAVVQLWNICLPRDGITLPIFQEKVLLDPNYDPEGCLLATDMGRLVGYVDARVRTTPHPWGFERLLEADRETGWIIALFVRPEYRRKGLGTELLEAGLEFLRAKGRRRAILFNYTPNYLLVGLDEEGYPGAREFYEKNGFAAGGESVGMAVELLGFRNPEHVRGAEEELLEEGIRAVHYEPRLLLPTLAFLREHFPLWVHYFTDKLARGHDHDEIVVVTRESEVVGYCQHRYYHHVERTGPFGVAADLRGRGIGSVMLCRLLERMAQKGYRQGWFTGTDTGTAHYYERCGYRVVRRHVGMSRAL